MLSKEQIVKKWVSTSLTVSDFIEAIRSIEREAYKQGQERMRERAVSQAAEESGEHGTDSDGWYICKSLSHQIEELEIEEPK